MSHSAPVANKHEGQVFPLNMNGWFVEEYHVYDNDAEAPTDIPIIKRKGSRSAELSVMLTSIQKLAQRIKRQRAGLKTLRSQDHSNSSRDDQTFKRVATEIAATTQGAASRPTVAVLLQPLAQLEEANCDVCNLIVGVEVSEVDDVVPQPVVAEAVSVVAAEAVLQRCSPKVSRSALCDSVQKVAENASSFHQYMIGHDERFRPGAAYLEKHVEVSFKMRQSLCDWLHKVHYKFRLQPDTFFLVINFIVRYLSEKTDVSRANLWFVVVSCLIVASKYDGCIDGFYPPKVSDYVNACGNAWPYTRVQVLDMEKSILATLNFNLTVAHPCVFLDTFVDVFSASKDARACALMLLEAVVIDYSFVSALPSKLTAAAVYLGMLMTGAAPDLSEERCCLLNCSRVELLEVAGRVNAAPFSDSVQKNYSLELYGNIFSRFPKAQL